MVFHVEYPRVIPERKPEGHQPAAPRYTLRWRKPVGMMVSQYHAIQGAALPWDQQRAFFDLAENSLAEQDGASAHEIMRFVDEAGEVNAVVASCRNSRRSVSNTYSSNRYRKLPIPRWPLTLELCRSQRKE
jgi:aliphatic aldoxime dehydratase